MSSCSDGALALDCGLLLDFDDDDDPLVADLEELDLDLGVVAAIVVVVVVSASDFLILLSRAKASESSSLDNFSKQPSQTLTFFSIFNLGNGICCDEHLAQKMLPQFLQWCFLATNVN